MKNHWNPEQATTYAADPLGLRVYTSRLLGQEESLVLHGGGNTSVKLAVTNLFGETEQVLYVKGSGGDLKSITASGFAPVRLKPLLQMAALDTLDDSAMVKMQRAAMLDPDAPRPSVEAILHALIPFKYVDHSHADAVLTLSNSRDGAAILPEIYHQRVLILPYVMPGFALAKQIHALSQHINWQDIDGIILQHHGIFTFADEAEISYRRMIELVSLAEDALRARAKSFPAQLEAVAEDLPALARIRQSVAQARGSAVLVNWDRSPAARAFSAQAPLLEGVRRGSLTPDHVIRTKPWPLLLTHDVTVDDYVAAYHAYFQAHQHGQTCLNPAPCWALWPGHGALAFAPALADTRIIADIAAHTMQAVQTAEESLGGWQGLPSADIFAMEYWELEQAKLGKNLSVLPLQGKIALVSGAATGIGKACVTALRAQGAVVAALDKTWPSDAPEQTGVLNLTCDVTTDVNTAVAATVRAFGGLDIVISNAGIFPPSATIADMPAEIWDASLAVNLTAHQRLLQACAPYLALGIDPAVVMIASKNVPAPGPGAAAYSVAKAGQTQLARVAALEFGKAGVRVNVLHPNAVFDTAIWTDEVLAKRAQHYGMNVTEYKTNNILRTEVRSRDVAELACALAGPLFAKTTGAQIPIDGGNERVI
jgi:rhamnose utilization protein RhaD (predicted bifunctional aldolase and dehydrogenase)/NAD(P)-dependent dehydrogenase (short-subunit alcohol dehydrogenase family)